MHKKALKINGKNGCMVLRQAINNTEDLEDMHDLVSTVNSVVDTFQFDPATYMSDDVILSHANNRVETDRKKGIKYEDRPDCFAGLLAKLFPNMQKELKGLNSRLDELYASNPRDANFRIMCTPSTTSFSSVAPAVYNEDAQTAINFTSRIALKRLSAELEVRVDGRPHTKRPR